MRLLPKNEQMNMFFYPDYCSEACNSFLMQFFDRMVFQRIAL